MIDYNDKTIDEEDEELEPRFDLVTQCGKGI